MASHGAGRPGGRGGRRRLRGELGGRGVPGGGARGGARGGQRAAGGGAVALRAPAAAFFSACPRVSQPLSSGAGGYGKRRGSALGWPCGGRAAVTRDPRAVRTGRRRGGGRDRGAGSGVGAAVPTVTGTCGPGSAAAPSHRRGAEAAGRGSALGGRPRLCALPAWGRAVPGGRRGRREARARGAGALRAAGAARAGGQQLLQRPRRSGAADPAVPAEGRLPESCARALQAG